MKLTLHKPAGIHLVRGYAPGEVRIGDQPYRTSVLVAAERLVTDWAPERIGDLKAEHVEAILELEPEIVLLGSGREQRFPAPALLAPLLERGIGVEVMDTGAACRTYNVLVSEDRRVVAALFVAD
ncbi:MAG TPA: Mth938-like domain-containing protein [Steroidobacteraceae bacterium]|nr:Mth938-like domain-containing protein [Steroidobacteraceae bacterium]